MSATPSQLIRLSFVVVLVLRTLSCFIGTEAAIYRPSNYADKKQVQDIKVVFSNVHSLMFCRDCDDPLSEGSIVIPWKVHYNPEIYHVSSVLVFAIPNDGSYALYNEHELAGKIAVFTRGKVSVVHKVQIAQNAGALAAMVIDSDMCDRETMHCYRTEKDEPLAAAHARDGLGLFHDDPASLWLNIRIPVAMISAEDGARIRSFMDLVVVEVNGEMNYLVGV